MPEYITPGVYVEEIESSYRPIEGVGSAVAGFVGLAPRDTQRNVAVACNNWTQFVRNFVADDSTTTPLAQAVFTFFENGGTRCHVVNVGKGNPVYGDGKGRKGIECLETVDEIACIAAPGAHDAASHDALLSLCERMGDRIAVLDGPVTENDLQRLTQVATQPPAAAGGDADTTTRRPATGLRPRVSDRGFGAFYFPWIKTRNALGGGVVDTPPSGAVAGVFARVSATRGVHKAPANEVLRGALGVCQTITRQEQGELNRHGVNCIRVVTNAVRIWGARTVAEAASDMRYVNVRRLMNFLVESIEEGTSGFVFEPNDAYTQAAVAQSISSFLMLQWRAGALVGATAEKAFFVKCDAENNPPDVVDAGQLIAHVGVACSKPAEFVVFRISQIAGGDGQSGASAAG